MDARIVEYEADRTFTIEVRVRPVEGSKLTYSIESVEGKTVLSTDLEMRLSAVWTLMRPILSRRRIRDRQWGVNSVKRILKARTAAGAKRFLLAPLSMTPAIKRSQELWRSTRERRGSA